MSRHALAARKGALHRHEDPGAQLRLRAGDLVAARALADAGDLAEDHVEERGAVARRAAGIDAEQTAVHIARGETGDGVGEAALLARFLEQARRHPAAEQGGEHLERRKRFVVVGNALAAEHQMQLFQIAVDAAFAAAVAGRRGLRRRLRRQGGESAPRQVAQAFVVHRAGRREDHARRRVAALQPVAQGAGAERRNALRGAEHRPPDRLVGIGGLLKVVEHDIVGRVARLADFLNDYVLFARQFVLGEGRLEEDVAEEVDGERQVFRKCPRVISGVLARRISVEMAADGLDLGGDGEGVAPPRALEGHMFEQMGDAVERRRFAARAGVDPHPDGDRLEPRHMLAGDAQAVVESIDDDIRIPAVLAPRPFARARALRRHAMLRVPVRALARIYAARAPGSRPMTS